MQAASKMTYILTHALSGTGLVPDVVRQAQGDLCSGVDDVVGKFGQGLKGLQCNRMFALVRDVGDAI